MFVELLTPTHMADVTMNGSLNKCTYCKDCTNYACVRQLHVGRKGTYRKQIDPKAEK